jgi:ubiquinone/menaquinone biosynthesis C-methylase UbiE
VNAYVPFSSEEYEQRDSVLAGNYRSVVERYKNEIVLQFPSVPCNAMTILDVGVGSGLDLSIFEEFQFQTYGIDISEEMTKGGYLKSVFSTH